MTNKSLNLIIACLVVLSGCSKVSSDSSEPGSSSDLGYSSSGGGMSGGGNGGNEAQPGVITAGEWNDQSNWAFWDTIILRPNLVTMPDHWSFYNNNRIAVKLVSTGDKGVADVPVKLKSNGTVVYTAKTDNEGNAELWFDLFEKNEKADFSKLSIDINNGAQTITSVKPFKDGVNKATLSPVSVANKIEISFVVDATGSMGDELEYLKTELLDVIGRIRTANPASTVSTSSVFYRDEGDEYVTKVSNFTNDNNTTVNFIKAQSAGGGGDFPEAVHSALDKAVNELQWSSAAKTRIMFLELDAPPHHESSVIKSLQKSTQKAAEKGIKIIPITASGIDKETEFLMRFLALSTNGTYVFVTNHSGIGGEHLEATVGEYEVEYLNNLMVRLINKYAK